MQPDELFAAAQARAGPLDTLAPPSAHEVERLRAEAFAFFARVPEPPVYRRSGDPVHAAAGALLPQAEALLARALRLAQAGAGESAWALVAVLKAYGALLCHVEAGRLGPAEEAWAEARAAARGAQPTRALRAADAPPPPVFDRASGASRYDPRSDVTLQARLRCPNAGCKREDVYAFGAAHATHRFGCPACGTPFLGYFGEMVAMELAQEGGTRRYRFTLDELGGGGSTRIDFEEGSGEDFTAARGDLLGFLYTEARELRVVVDVTSGRILWVSAAGGCFLATAAFGPGARELEAFRGFRDRVLLPRTAGRLAVRGYYRYGPGAAAWLGRHPRARALVRAGLVQVHRVLESERTEA